MKDNIIALAKNKGFDDIRFAKACVLEKPERQYACFDGTLIFDPREILIDAKCAIVLFAGYTPVLAGEKGIMNVSEYNRVSNRSYRAAREIAAFIVQSGGKAVLDWRLYAKGAALMAGGFSGRNGLYYHEFLGSTVCIHTIVTDLGIAEEYEKARPACGACRACEKGCPTGAISQEGGLDVKKCLRKYTGGTVPEEMRFAVYQLFGCEKCQAACPLNQKKEVLPLGFKTAELLNGCHIEALAAETGKNTARSQRVLSQALLYAGSSGDKTLLPLVERHLASSSETVREHAIWAKNRLNSER